MPHNTETGSAQAPLDPASQACLTQTRTAVLNVLVAVGLIVAISGFVLRGRAREAFVPGPDRLHQVLMVGLVVIFVASHLARRGLSRRDKLRDPDHRARRFYWAHVCPAIIGGLAAPLGLVYGWFIMPRLEAVLPFWVVAVAVGVLALPRASELEGFDAPMSSRGEPVS